MPARNVEFPCKTPSAKDADEFVRLSCRGSAGWRRDEWAHSPLFIWGKFHLEMAAEGGSGLPRAGTQQGVLSREIEPVVQ
jgi:hypothetical protein